MTRILPNKNSDGWVDAPNVSCCRPTGVHKGKERKKRARKGVEVGGGVCTNKTPLEPITQYLGAPTLCSFSHTSIRLRCAPSTTALVAHACSYHLPGMGSSLSSAFAKESGLLEVCGCETLFQFSAFRTETRTATPAHCLQETEVCDCTSQHPVWPQLRADSGREGCYAPFFRLRERTRSAGPHPALR